MKLYLDFINVYCKSCTTGMTLFSKHVSYIDCKNVAHSFEPSCIKVSLVALRLTFKKSLGLYGFLYLVWGFIFKLTGKKNF